MLAYTKPQKRKKEEKERLRVEGDNIKIIDLGFEKWQVVALGKGRRQDVSQIKCSRYECNYKIKYTLKYII